MPLFDLSSPELEAHRTDVRTPPDLGEFWADTLIQARSLQQPVQARLVDSGLRLVQTWDVTFTGFDGHPVKAWYHRPTGAEAPLPVVVQYQGYGGGRGLAHEVRPWVLAGYAAMDVDTRGQGSMWGPGATADPVGSEPSYPGFITKGVRSREGYYYRRVFTDSIRAIDAALELPGADGRVVASGASQGGAMALAAAALHNQVVGVLADVPFLCDIPRAMDLCPEGPYAELVSFLAVHRGDIEVALNTLAYHDIAVLAGLADCPGLFSVGIMDTACPPSTVYAAFNAFNGPKRIEAYRYNDHEGGGGHHVVHQLRWLADLLG